jgi:phosphoribosyl 1,2-cyclic phosphodiesterase
MHVRLWGTRGSIAAPGAETAGYGGNTTCVEVILSRGHRIVIDAGTGIRRLGNVLMAAGDPVEFHLLISHIHWDHIMGFPFFLPIYRRGTRIHLDGCARALRGIQLTLNNGMVDGVFPVAFEELPARIEPLGALGSGPLEVGAAVVQGIELQHPQGGMGFRIREGGSSLVFLTDNELRSDAWVGRAPEDYARFCRGAQLLIHDAQYRSEEMAIKRGWGHSDCNAAVDLALEAGVERLLLTHHDPERSDAQVDAMVDAAREHAWVRGGQGLIVEGAREGDRWSL